ncbi:sensor histidine kinase [Streptococcus oricebi]|uniref:histidine kinase n=1 Tax=Streptococcus oricebi TaxID=1547447 RepID=A0ABS5B3S3_9STRE|nr:HAMP domain-containing sensor histidine kinase [Streptococcus oricebi]MBP2623483.1 sensor histidine kinase [Streptococcus oricebi]
MARTKSFKRLVRETYIKIGKQFFLSLLFLYFFPLSTVSVRASDIRNFNVFSIFFNISSWIYICFILVIIITLNIGELLQVVKQEMEVIHKKSMWLDSHSDDVELTLTEFIETRVRIEKMQVRIKTLLEEERLQKQDLMFKVSAAAHDLKTPLTVIQGNAEFLQLTSRNEQEKQCLADIEQASQQLNSYFSQLIDYSKTFYDERKEWQVYPVNDLVDLVQQEIVPIIRGKASFDFDFQPVQDRFVRINTKLVVRALMNIVSNALEYMNKLNPKIKFQVDIKNEMLLFSIWNNGSEFSDDVLQNFGKLFYRGDSSRQIVSNHFGIGLAFVNRVAKKHQGRLTLENDDRGAKVIFALPLKD